MPKTLTEVTRDAADLPAPGRLKLARILLNLSEAATESPEDVQNTWDQEIERRLQELRSGKVSQNANSSIGRQTSNSTDLELMLTQAQPPGKNGQDR